MAFEPALQWPGHLDPNARRVEIDEFIADNAMTNLFLLALHELQEQPIRAEQDEDWFTFYNLASIHGYPLEAWRGAPNKQADNKNDKGFYCTHGSTVFPTWHRCLMAMFEQAVYKRMAIVANKFSEQNGRSQFLEALKHYRLPYWDPIMPRNPMGRAQTEAESVRSMFGIPDILSAQKVWVLDPHNGETQIDNPLRRFSFPSSADYQKTGRTTIPWNRTGMPSTASRWTLRTPNARGETDDDQLNENIRDQARELSTQLWQLLNPGTDGDDDNQEKPWDVFANHFKNKASGQGGFWPPGVSLESWHDQIHVLVGSGQASGHMALPQVASFDPIFFMHHNNVERLFAIYQALYGHLQNKFVSQTTVPPNRLNAASELSPFQRDGQGKCFNSADVKDWTLDAYATPGVKPLDANGRDQLAKYLYDTYFWASNMTAPPSTLTYPRNLSKVFALQGGKFELAPSQPVSFVALDHSKVIHKSVPQDSAKPVEKVVEEPMKNETQNQESLPLGSFVDREKGTMMTWNALTRIPKYAFGESFMIQVFIGKDSVPDDGSSYFNAPSEVGYSGVFASGDYQDCDNCKQNANQEMIYEDIIPLTTYLPKYLRTNTANPERWPPAELRILEDLSPDNVVPFLSKHLEWRIVNTAGVVKSSEEVRDSGLSLAVASRYFDYPTEDNRLGTYSAHTAYPEVTTGKIGGYEG